MLNDIHRYKNRLRNTAKHYSKKLLFGESIVPPRLIVLGAQKAGTTAFYTYLSRHPEIQVPRPKELNYFSSIEPSTLDINAYLNLFPRVYKRHTDRISIDVSPSYLIDSKRCLTLAEQLNLKLKYIVLLREPLARAVSAWHMYRQLNDTTPGWFLNESWVINFQNLGLNLVRRKADFGKNFNADIEQELEVLEQGKRIELPIVEFGLYEQQLSTLYSLVDSSRVLLINSQELKNNTKTCLNKVISFMELSHFDFKVDDLNPQFVGHNKPKVSERELEPLRQYYQQRNRGLEQRLDDAKQWLTC